MKIEHRYPTGVEWQDDLTEVGVIQPSSVVGLVHEVFVGADVPGAVVYIPYDFPDLPADEWIRCRGQAFPAARFPTYAAAVPAGLLLPRDGYSMSGFKYKIFMRAEVP